MWGNCPPAAGVDRPCEADDAAGAAPARVGRYQVRTDKTSGIVNDVNDWGLDRGEPRYIVDLVKRIVTVSLETMAIVRALPELREAE